MTHQSISTTSTPIRQWRTLSLAVTGFLAGISVFLLIFGALSFYINVRGIPTRFSCQLEGPPKEAGPTFFRVYMLGPGSLFYRDTLYNTFFQIDYTYAAVEATQVAFLILISALPFGLLSGLLGFLLSKAGMFKTRMLLLLIFGMIVVIVYGLTGFAQIFETWYRCWLW